jgi:hypothetical protein
LAEGNDGPNETYEVRGQGYRVLDADQFNRNGKQVEGGQRGLAEYYRRIREADAGTEDSGGQGGRAEGNRGARGQVAEGPGSTLSPGNSPPQRGSPALTGPQARRWKLRQKREELERLKALQRQMVQGEQDVRAQVDQEREDARQESRKRDIQRERTRRKKEKTGEKKASGRARIPMKDENDVTIYDLSGRPRYHPHEELHDGAATKKKPPPRRPTSPTSPTTPMATSTPATRASTRRRNTPQHLADYIHGADYDSDRSPLED